MSNRTVVVRAGTGEVMAAPAERNEFELTAESTGGVLEWITATVNYGGGPPYHIHHQADEALLMLEGELKVKLDGDLFDLKPGDVVFIPRGVPHTFTNVHQDQPACFTGVYTPAGIQKFLQVWGETFEGGPPDEAAMAELAARYGQEPAGPPLAVELGLVGDKVTG